MGMPEGIPYYLMGEIMESRLKGTIASNGVTIGKVYKFVKEKVEVDTASIDADDIDREIEKVKNAIESYRSELTSRDYETDAEKGVAEAHEELLSDPYLIDTISDKITNERVTSDNALNQTILEMVAMMEALDDEYLKERALDYKDIGQRIMYALKGIKPKTLENLDDNYIIISDELTPSDTSTLDKEHTLAFAMDLGGKTSHVSIIAQTLGIPALVGMGNVTEVLKDGEYIVLDAENGYIIVNPSDETIKKYEEKINKLEKEKARLESVKTCTPKTEDGHEIQAYCNIGGYDDLIQGLDDGADGVGLFRTEFLYMNNTHFPTEMEQFEEYKRVAEALEGRDLIIRTLDIGGDKSLPYYAFPEEENPMLGWRALRVCFDKEDMFKTQLRAILRASAFGTVKILLPMIISVEEIKRVNEILDSLKHELRERKIDFDENLEVGIMVETPASVMIAEELIKYCDFFSIGTNDLTQYFLAVDRGNEMVSEYYNTYNPAVLRAIKKVIDASHKAGKITGMCGGFAGDTDATYLLLGMGLDEFSSPSSKVAKIKDIVINSNYEDAKEFADEVLALESLTEVLEKIEKNKHK